MKANLSTLVTTARDKSFATASNGRWKAYRHTNGDVAVEHYATLMCIITADNEFIRVSHGWGSMSDKCGITAIKRGVHRATGDPKIYTEIEDPEGGRQ